MWYKKEWKKGKETKIVFSMGRGLYFVSLFSNVHHYLCFWPTHLTLGCVPNLSSFSWRFICLVDEIKPMELPFINKIKPTVWATEVSKTEKKKKNCVVCCCFHVKLYQLLNFTRGIFLVDIQWSHTHSAFSCAVKRLYADSVKPVQTLWYHWEQPVSHKIASSLSFTSLLQMPQG